MPVTTDRSPETVPTARAIRARLRRVRKQRHTGSVAEALTDAYVVVVFVAAYGWTAVINLRGALGSSAGQQTDAGVRYWIAVAAVLAVAGLGWRGLRILGPLLVTPATQTWVVSSPVDRRAWLLPRFGWLVLGAATGVGLLSLAAAAIGGADQGSDFAWSVLAGTSCGAASAALSVIAQGARREPRWARVVDASLIAASVAIALIVIISHVIGTTVPVSSAPIVTGIGIAALPVAMLATVYASRALASVDRAALTTGAQFANAAATAAVLLDPSILTGLLESRRWRAVGRVRSRHFPATGRHFPATGRFRVLLRAEFRRPLRHPSAVAAWAALVLGMYAAAVALPSIASATHLVLAYLATGRLTGGLRALSRSPGLRRSLGGDDTVLRLAHIVVPAVGALLWYVVTLPVVQPDPGLINLVLLLGVLAAAYRAGTRPPMEYGGVVVDTPMGMIPVDVIRQILRGPDLVAVMIIVQLIWA